MSEVSLSIRLEQVGTVESEASIKDIPCGELTAEDLAPGNKLTRIETFQDLSRSRSSEYYLQGLRRIVSGGLPSLGKASR